MGRVRFGGSVIKDDPLFACAQVHKGYHMKLRKFVAIKRVNTTNKVGTLPAVTGAKSSAST